jgi:hypothetical protein
MRSKSIKKYLDVLLVIFFVGSVFVFVKRNVINSYIDDVTKYPLTEIQLSFDTSISLGKINSVMPINYSGFIRNNGAENLHIGNLETSCGCTNFSISKLLVEPMDSTEISFSIKPIEKGKDIVNIYFDANTKKRRHRIIVQYEVIKQ